MNRKAILLSTIIFLILLIIFFSTLFIFTLNQMNNASLWSEYYAKETTKLINFASPGDEITLDVHKATEIAKSNKVKTFSEIFSINNPNNEVCVKLSPGRKTCYNYFNNVDIINTKLNLGTSEKNTLTFQITEKQLGVGNA